MEQLDQTDITILRILQEDSKKTAKEIAGILNLTSSPVYERIRRLEKQGLCYHMAGQVDFVLKIHTKGLEEYHDFVKTKLSKIENIGVLNSTFVLKEIKHTSEFYI